MTKDYYPLLKKDSAPEIYKHLFDTPIYKTCLKGAKFYKFSIEAISFLPKENQDAKVIVIVRGNHWRKDNSISEVYEFNLTDTKLVSMRAYLFTSLVDFFVYKEINPKWKKMLAFRGTTKQYEHEAKQIKIKYAEYFL